MSWQTTRIETERLLLRPPQAEDFDAWAANLANVESARFIGGLQSRAVAWRGFLTMVGAWAVQGFGMFSVIEKSSGQWIGRMGPWFPEGWPGREVGWGLARHSWGKGYAIEGAAACMDFAFDQLGWDEVIHSIDPANESSKALAKKLGSALRGPGRLPEPFEHVPIEIWGQTREQWRQRA
jgi:RimJ/RimL family protein N-acetyltransferase